MRTRLTLLLLMMLMMMIMLQQHMVSTADPGGSPAVQCSNYSNSTMFGTDPAFHECITTTFAECCSMCAQTPRCQAWDAAVTGKPRPPYGNCWLHDNSNPNTNIAQTLQNNKSSSLSPDDFLGEWMGGGD